MTVLALVLAFGLAVAPVASAGDWRRPVGGPVLREFRLAADRFAPGQHRGVDLGGRLGGPVRATCDGRVTFAGRVPGGGLTISVRCGRLIATYQQLGSIAVQRGALVARGSRLATVGRSRDRRSPDPHVHLGARVATTGRYVDPLSLIGVGRPALPALPIGTRRALRRAPRKPSPVRPRALRPLAGSRRAPASLPWTVWLGLLCVGLGLPIGGLVTHRRRRRTSAALARAAT